VKLFIASAMPEMQDITAEFDYKLAFVMINAIGFYTNINFE